MPATPGRCRPSKREGIEFNNHCIAAPWLLLDGDLAVSRARFTTDDPTTPGRYVPGSKATTLAYLRVGCRVTSNVRVALDVFNLFDRKASDVDYFYASRLKGEPVGGVDDIHFHPVEPRRLRLSLLANF